MRRRPRRRRRGTRSDPRGPLRLRSVLRLTVDAGSAGARLDAFLAASGAAPSAAAARRTIARGLVRVDGRRARKGVRLVPGQVVEVELAAAAPAGDAAPPLVVLYEDPDLVAVAKPGGLPSAQLTPGPTLAGALIARYPECATASPDPREGGLAHRLDTGTSGVLVAARHPAAWRGLRAALGAADCQKTYLAEVLGRVPHELGVLQYVSQAGEGRLVVSAPIGRTGRRGARVKLGGGRNPLDARTELRVLDVRAQTTLLEARLNRGRAHQVRVHLAHLGCPVLGDPLYGPAETVFGERADLHLHALAIVFRHPSRGEMMRVEAPAPAWATAPGPGLPFRNG